MPLCFDPISLKPLTRYTPVIVGDAEVGKSKTIEHLLPRDLRRYFNRDFNFRWINQYGKRDSEAVLSMLLVEPAEMSGFNASKKKL